MSERTILISIKTTQSNNGKFSDNSTVLTLLLRQNRRLKVYQDTKNYFQRKLVLAVQKAVSFQLKMFFFLYFIAVNNYTSFLKMYSDKYS